MFELNSTHVSLGALMTIIGFVTLMAMRWKSARKDIEEKAKREGKAEARLEALEQGFNNHIDQCKLEHADIIKKIEDESKKAAEDRKGIYKAVGELSTAVARLSGKADGS